MSFPANQGKPWVLITGASSGIGEVFAKRFAHEGWNIVLNGRSADKLESLAKTLAAENETETVVIKADLALRESPRNIYEELKRRKIELYGLVNNAGFGFGGAFAEVPLDQYLGMIDVMIRALVELSGLFLPEMIRRKRGLIINVSSTASFTPLPYSSVYSASKAFATSFTEALWLETQGTGVRILNLCPGLTKTDFGIRAGLRDFRDDPFAQSPEEVVETAFRALKGNSPIAISGLRNKILTFLIRYFPHWFVLRVVLWVQKSRGRV
ncbi:MAG: hypothetical protein A3C35_04990 [Omnitrophica bacterium RIFCSPHIGHO2_02_FULL_46_11]|nr:MAG: hypothetical protein A3C35_04990 [Omnitrophica bacterium RIFCSPHIGHO2_02_FULL_46_11]